MYSLKNLSFSVFFSFAVLAGISGCSNSLESKKRAEAWVPIYKPKAETEEIKNLPAKAPEKGGKIYVWDDFLFQIEPDQGIHVYRIENQETKPVSFIQIYGAQEISIKDNILYTNNLSDLVSLDIQDIEHVRVLARAKDAFTSKRDFQLPPSRGFFECYDSSKGIIIGWELKTDVEAACKY